MKFIFILLPLLGSLLSAIGQDQSVIKPLTIGDTVPNIEIRNIINYPTTTAHLADFKGKLLILDFWATWCSSCIAMFPQLDTLEKAYPDRLVVLGVTSGSPQVSKNFFDTRKRIGETSSPLTSVTSDSILGKMFIHTFIPHYVWINKDGAVIAITDAEQINAINIKRAIIDNKMDLPVKIDQLRKLNIEEPLFEIFNPIIMDSGIRLDTIKNEDLGIRSIMTGHLDNMNYFSGGDMRNMTARVTAVNNSISELYTVAYGHLYTLRFFNRVRWEVKDSSLYRLSNDFLDRITSKSLNAGLQWRNKNTFSYELQTFNPVLKERIFEIMSEDLNRYFGALYGIIGTVEKRRVHCLILTRTISVKELEKRVSKQDTSSERNLAHERYTLRFRDKTMEDLTSWYLSRALDTRHFLYPLVNATGYNGKANLDFKGDLTRVSSINEDLKKYGLKLVEGERKIDLIIIKDHLHFHGK